jgi:hypothetical protein
LSSFLIVKELCASKKTTSPNKNSTIPPQAYDLMPLHSDVGISPNAYERLELD